MSMFALFILIELKIIKLNISRGQSKKGVIKIGYKKYFKASC